MLLNKLVMFIFFFFKQKTAYEMRSSDWSSDVCSSDLVVLRSGPGAFHRVPAVGRAGRVVDDDRGLRALARGFLELVGPAPVIGHALAFEQALVAGVEAGVVDSDDEGLRSEERRVGYECDSKCRSRGSTYHLTKKKKHT